MFFRMTGGVLRSLRRMGLHLKGDERILGDSDFAESVLGAENEKMERSYQLQARGYDFGKLVHRVAESHEIEGERGFGTREAAQSGQSQKPPVLLGS